MSQPDPSYASTPTPRRPYLFREGSSFDDAELRRALDESRRFAEAAQAHGVPLVTEPLALSHLALQYAGHGRAAVYEAKALFLERRYASLRRIIGDGNCFFRALLTSWMEWLVNQPPETQADTWGQLITSVSETLVAELPLEFRAPLVELGRAVAEWTRA
eukprot:3255182-Prymnesium_polylepis.1